MRRTVGEEPGDDVTRRDAAVLLAYLLNHAPGNEAAHRMGHDIEADRTGRAVAFDPFPFDVGFLFEDELVQPTGVFGVVARGIEGGAKGGST